MLEYVVAYDGVIIMVLLLRIAVFGCCGLVFLIWLVLYRICVWLGHENYYAILLKGHYLISHMLFT